MRIENSYRAAAARGSAASRGNGGGFFVQAEPASGRAAALQQAGAPAGIDALLALQAVEDPLFAKKKALRRGTVLLDTLETVKADLLLGQVSEGRLNQLMSIITSTRERSVPGLDDVLDDIELRARVELAKFGRYPA